MDKQIELKSKNNNMHVNFIQQYEQVNSFLLSTVQCLICIILYGWIFLTQKCDL